MRPNIIDKINNSYEYDYFKSITDKIDLDTKIDIVFMKWDAKVPDTENKCVLFVTSDEHHRQHPHLVEKDNVAMVFRNYIPEKYHHKVRALPLGYLQGFEHEDTDFNERQYSFSFSGTLPDPPCEPTRQYLYRALDRMPKDLDGFVLFYKGWAKGLDMEEYSKLMYDSKIALCPNGYTSAETFRYFEAAKAGCVIISEPKPYTWFYSDGPHIEISNWLDLPNLLPNLLKDKQKLEYYHKRTKQWWEDNCSPQAVANYVMDELNEIKV